jgi:hypothetical protein
MSDKTTKKIPCEVYSRIVGYLRPVQNWNKGKRQEFDDRKTYRTQVEAGDATLAAAGDDTSVPNP